MEGREFYKKGKAGSISISTDFYTAFSFGSTKIFYFSTSSLRVTLLCVA